jgi:hypothetical protein
VSGASNKSIKKKEEKREKREEGRKSVPTLQWEVLFREKRVIDLECIVVRGGFRLCHVVPFSRWEDSNNHLLYPA